MERLIYTIQWFLGEILTGYNSGKSYESVITKCRLDKQFMKFVILSGKIPKIIKVTVQEAMSCYFA